MKDLLFSLEDPSLSRMSSLLKRTSRRLKSTSYKLKILSKLKRTLRTPCNFAGKEDVPFTLEEVVLN